MAQYFTDFQNGTIGELPVEFEDEWCAGPAAGDTLEEVSPLPGKSFVVRGNSFNRRALRYKTGVETVDAEIRAVIKFASITNSASIATLILRGDNPCATRTGYVLWIRPGSNSVRVVRHIGTGSESGLGAENEVTFNSSWADPDGASEVLFSVSEASPTAAEVKVWIWPRGDTKPETPVISAMNSLGAILTPGWQGVGTISNTNFNQSFEWVGIGTDGDPAPTGPVDVSAEPFRLRHNPRTNKVIPVLSSPTVTDIGATCVRPRITKGF